MSGWISIKDALPGIGKQVITSYGPGTQMHISTLTIAGEQVFSDGGGEDCYEVFYWHPLPDDPPDPGGHEWWKA